MDLRIIQWTPASSVFWIDIERYNNCGFLTMMVAPGKDNSQWNNDHNNDQDNGSNGNGKAPGSFE